MKTNAPLNLGALRELYRSGAARAFRCRGADLRSISRGPLEPVWISLVPRETALARARALEKDPLAPARPLYGVPFAIKDNIDLAGLATTAGCPAYSYQPAGSATVVQALVDAGAIAIGKTNLDQFATGLVGMRSPHGACSSVFDARYISGGSSAGSAVAVAKGLASFALGTDTAGSGRVPAAFNGLIGLKPTRGLLSTLGRGAGLPHARLRFDPGADLSRRPHGVAGGPRLRPAGPLFARRRPWPGRRAVAGRRFPLRRARGRATGIFRRPGGGGAVCRSHRNAGIARRGKSRNRFLAFPCRGRPAVLRSVGGGAPGRASDPSWNRTPPR